jgi:hypothetical protein
MPQQQTPQGIFQSIQYLLRQVKILALQKQPTYTGISISANYPISRRGIYYVTSSNASFGIIMPDPALMNGMTITIMNGTAASDVSFSNANGFAPKNKATTSVIASLSAGGILQIVSVNNLWIGGVLS